MILITGASGTIGAEVVKALAERGARFRAAYRSRPQNLPQGVESVALDYDKPETLGPALRGVKTLFLLSTTVAPEVTVAKEAKAAGVERVVKLSVMNSGEPGFTFGAWHRVAEDAIERSGLLWTHLRPNGFMQNVVTYMAGTIKSQGALYSSAADGKVSTIDARDIGAAAARVLTEPGHEGKAYELTGPAAIGYAEIAAILTRVLGRTVTYVPITDEESKRGAVGAGTPEAYADALVNLNQLYREGKFARVSPDLRTLLGREPRAFEAFAQEHAAAWK